MPSNNSSPNPANFSVKPPKHLINKALDRLERQTLHSFATDLELARSVWRSYRGLVEAPEFPARLRAICEEEDDCPIVDSFYVTEIDPTAPGLRRQLRPQAIQIARHWILSESGFSDDDDQLLAHMGIRL